MSTQREFKARYSNPPHSEPGGGRFHHELHSSRAVGRRRSRRLPHGFRRLPSSWALFEPWGYAFYLIDEDAWYPNLVDGGVANYELRVSLPKERRAVAPGRLVEDKADGEQRRYAFRTTRPQKPSSLFIGKFQHETGEADGTKVDAFVGQNEKNLTSRSTTPGRR